MHNRPQLKIIDVRAAKIPFELRMLLYAGVDFPADILCHIEQGFAIFAKLLDLAPVIIQLVFVGREIPRLKGAGQLPQLIFGENGFHILAQPVV